MPPPNSGPRIVSLGGYCGVRKSVQKIGRDAASLPFDWMRTRIEGILHYMRTDFQGFFDYSSTQRVPNAPVVKVYRDHFHSFWHDDLGDELVKAKYERRFARFKGLDASATPILFVRSLAHTRELALVDELAQELASRFGAQAMLLVIVDFQHRTLGPVFLQDRSNLLVYYLPTEAHRDPGGAPYSAPLLCALDWMEGRDIGAAPRVADVHALLDLADISPEWAAEGIPPFAELPAQPGALSTPPAGAAVQHAAGRPVAAASSLLAAHGAAQGVPLMAHAVGSAAASRAATPLTARAPPQVPMKVTMIGATVAAQPPRSASVLSVGPQRWMRDGGQGKVALPSVRHVFVTAPVALHQGHTGVQMRPQDASFSAHGPGRLWHGAGVPVACTA